MTDIYGITRIQLESWLAQQGFPSVHAKAIFRAVYKNLSLDLGSGVGLPLKLQSALTEGFNFAALQVVKHFASSYDQSVKFLVRLGDGQEVEMVLMPEKTRLTLCLSSQVGCRQACVFCHTGRMGLLRNLSPGEMVGQVVLANQWLARHPELLAAVRLPAGMRVTNIVFMGMGEPLDNVEAVITALSILKDPYGLCLTARRLTVSTAGHREGLEQLIAADLGVSLALSLHASDDGERSRLMPINKRFPIADILALLRSYTQESGRDVMIQYTVIGGVNDSPAHAARLAALLAGIKVKVNLIPLNPIAVSRLVAPAPERLEAFHRALRQAGLRTMIRFSKGQDITAACGQLVVAQ